MHERKRARQACTQCNSRRVKCNVTEAVPCDNCVAAGCKCELRESRRGKHPRTKTAQKPGKSTTEPSSVARKDSISAQSVKTAQYSPEETSPIASIPPAVLAATTPAAQSVRAASIIQDDELGQASLALASLCRGTPQDADVFLGESNSVRYVGSDGTTTNAAQFHAIPTEETQSMMRWETERREAIINDLKSRPDGPFSFPPRRVVISLLKAYFRWFHTCQAVVDETDVWQQFETGNMSPLLLQSMLFVAAVHCEDAVLTEGNLGNRHEAKFKFYMRARDLYDADIENNNLIVIQSLFLISFWRGHVPQEKDVRHWLGAAISLAQRRGVHRSKQLSNPGSAPTAAADRISKLRKRLWWSIYVRERQASAALGLPNRIRDEDCDVEPLEEADFQYTFHAGMPLHEARDYVAYATGMTQLARFLGEVVHRIYLPNKSFTPADRLQMRDELLAWKQQLPPSMQVGDDLGSQAGGLHANMLHLAYNNVFILLYRSCYVNGSGGTDGQVALQAAARNSRIIEDILPRGILRHAQIHVITNLFNTLCMHTIELRRGLGTAKAIAEHRAKVCLMGLQELQQTWEVRNWVLQLFFRYLDQPTAARLQSDVDDNSSHTRSPAGNLAFDFGDFTRTDVPKMNMTIAPDVDTIWAWPNEETDRFLFSQIYNGFSYGEGSWGSPMERFNA
ncbi:hypothetical protein VHEMI05740 [[Torrubiella] hemipterigena]|uniref:Zn(2)-C6 fungal-type domain-containing protein n=1 Tax=[Torrubiella] hemipterigena TaxID=1531966 RepID=A0A0A1SYQ1_9HYPO|nr:hypothetical protein VHEMI05740 [[Torrubiella] hemipterigena]